MSKKGKKIKNILVVSGHPNLEKSNANSLILNELKANLNNVSVRDLGKLYPSKQIDVRVEQEALIKADIIVLQFPLYWYSYPGLMKVWLDEVLSYGFAYGSTGDKLRDKPLIVSFTAGAPKEAYSKEGLEGYEMSEFLPQFDSLTRVSLMRYLPPVYSYGMFYEEGVSDPSQK
ncbi:MAG: NAD(P)H-dependent oxidoreductase, partial [Campylobacter sp.]|nr:NAD(P)H-dependent oxidoreductase [Campylobacter sp.]